jgi:shikimate kinase
MPDGLALMPGLFLTGFMGSGKSTVGRLVADDLGWQFVDLDEEIERIEGMTIARIFDERGEAEFRRLETEALRVQVRAAERGQPRVVSLGGGAFAQEANRALLAGATIVWLDAPEPVLYERVAHQDHRPLARDRARFAALYAARQEAYAKASFRVGAVGEAPEVARRVLELPLW